MQRRLLPSNAATALTGLALDIPDSDRSYAENSNDCLRVIRNQFLTFGNLRPDDEQLLAEMAQTSHYHPPHRNLYATGLPAPPLRIIVSGWACRYRLLPDGRRQIINLRLPGDLIGHLLSTPMPSSCATGALTEMQTVNARAVSQVMMTNDERHAELISAVRLMCHFDDIMMCDQVVRLGRQTATARLAHLILRFHERLSRVGLAKSNRFYMPLTQEVLADVLGLSVVHMNRVIQELRRSGLLDLKSGVAEMLDIEKLKTMAAWSPLPVPSLTKIEFRHTS